MCIGLFAPKISRTVVHPINITKENLVLAKISTCELCLCFNLAASNFRIRCSSSSALVSLSNRTTLTSTRRTPGLTHLAAQELTVGMLDTQWPCSGRVQYALDMSSPCPLVATVV